MRWLKDPTFLELASAEQAEAETDPGPDAEQGLREQLVPKALRILDDALEGEKVTQHQIRAALEVVKASNALRQAAVAEKQESLADLIARLDTETGTESD